MQSQTRFTSSPPRLLWAVALTVILMLSMGAAATAREQLRFDTVKLGKGEARSEITGLAQDRRGFIWIGTRFGLLRFDGHETRTYRHDPARADSLAADAINALVADTTGQLWLGFETGQIDRFDPLRESALHLTFPEKGAFTVAMMASFADGIMVLTDGGNLFTAASGARSLEPFAPRGLAGAGAPSGLFIDPSGYLWISVTGGNPVCLRAIDGEVVDPGFRPAELDQVDSWLLRDTEGFLWGQATGGGLLRARLGENGAAGSIERVLADSALLIEVIVEEGDDLFIGTAGQGLIHYSREADTCTRYRAESAESGAIRSDMIAALLRDHSGAIWIGTDEGLNRYSRHRYKFGDFAIPLPGRANKHSKITALALDGEDNLWVGTLDAGLSVRRGEEIIPVRLTNNGGLIGNTVHAILPLDETHLLIAIDEGLLEYNIRTRDHRLLTAPMQITDILRARNGEIWITGYVIGLARLDPQTRRLRPFALTGSGGQLNATCMIEDGDGALWIGTDGVGIYRLTPERDAFYHYRRNPAVSGSISDDRILCLGAGRDGSLWIGTRSGLNRFEPGSGRFTRFSETHGLPDTFICAIAAAMDGQLWISTPSGLGRFDPRTAAAVAYDGSDGLRDERFTPQAVAVDRAGVIYFGNATGVSIVDPARLTINETPPQVAITSFRIAGVEALNPTASASLRYRIPWEQNFFTIDFAVLDFTEPGRNRAAFQLEGYDAALRTETGGGSVSYSRVPPGTYRFHLRGANNDGIWNESGAELLITVVPPFWMTVEFQILLLLLAGGAVFSVYKIRTSAIKRQRNLLQREVDERRIAQARLEANQDRLRSLAVRLTIAEEQERRRIAQLLHDQIGQSLMMSMVRLDKLVTSMQERKQVDEVQRVIAIINSVIVDTRSLTVELSPPSLYKFGLEAAIESLVDKFRKDHGINTVVLRGSDSRLSKEASVLLFQAARELLINVYKHAHANRVQVKLDNDGRTCFMTIEDDGDGFDVATVRGDVNGTKGFGLFSFQEQIENIGGTMVIVSAPGAGTRVTITIPLASPTGSRP